MRSCRYSRYELTGLRSSKNVTRQPYLVGPAPTFFGGQERHSVQSCARSSICCVSNQRIVRGCGCIGDLPSDYDRVRGIGHLDLDSRPKSLVTQLWLLSRSAAAGYDEAQDSEHPVPHLMQLPCPHHGPLLTAAAGAMTRWLARIDPPIFPIIDPEYSSQSRAMTLATSDLA